MGNFIEAVGKIFKGDAGSHTGGYFKADAKKPNFQDELIAKINPGYNPAYGDPSTLSARLSSGDVRPS